MEVINDMPKGDHYYGWGHIIDRLGQALHIYDSDIILDTWADQNSKAWPYNKPGANITKKWIGVVHSPIHAAAGMGLKKYIKSEKFRSCENTCMGLITLCNHTKGFLQSHVNVPVGMVYHPKIKIDCKFDVDEYLRKPKLYHSGFYSKNVEKFLEYECEIQKYIRWSRPRHVKWGEKNINPRTGVEIYFERFTREKYIQWLVTGIGYAHFNDCAASNVVLEHIMTGTPLVVNRLPAVVEYLGSDYPMYVDQFASEMLLDREFLNDIQEYLLQRSQFECFTYTKFTEKFFNIVKSFCTPRSL